jgi:hypothetical protein
MFSSSSWRRILKQLEVIRSCNSQKERQCNGQKKKKDKRTNNEFHESRLFQKRVVCTKFDIYVFNFLQQITTQKTKE